MSHSKSLPNKTVCTAAVVPVVCVCRFEKTVEVSASLRRFLKSALIFPLFSNMSGAVSFSAVIIKISLLIFRVCAPKFLVIGVCGTVDIKKAMTNTGVVKPTSQ